MAVVYPMFLSVTEPNNYIGVVKIRQYDEGTQVFDVTITENGKPKDFTGLTPFFCVKNGDHIGLGISEQIVTDVDPKNGKLRYTLTKYDMQNLGDPVAYFSFREKKKDSVFEWHTQFSTKDFKYKVIKGLYTDGIKDSNYIWTFEEILRYFQQWVEESMKTYDDWYIKAQEELQRIIKEFTDWISTNQEAYEEWLASQKFDFAQWQNANKDDFLQWFQSLKEILNENAAGNLQNQLDEIRPSKEIIMIHHDFKGYPRLRVLYWEYGMATRPLAMEPTGIGGGNVQTVESAVEYLDPYSLKVFVPADFRTVDPEFVFVDNKRFRLISDFKVLQVELLEEGIRGYTEHTVTLDFKDKISGSLVENPHKTYFSQAAEIPNPSMDTGEISTVNYTGIATVDGKTIAPSVNHQSRVMSIMAKFTIIEDVERRYPGYLKSIGAVSLEQKVVAVRALVDGTIRPIVYASGSGASTTTPGTARSQVNMQIWGTTWHGGATNTTNKLALLEYKNQTGLRIQDDGCVYIILYAPASDGVVASTVNLDYAALEYKIQIGGK